MGYTAVAAIGGAIVSAGAAVGITVAAATAATIATGVVVGAVVGGVSAAISGGNILKGVLGGALIGGVTAGIGAALAPAAEGAAASGGLASAAETPLSAEAAEGAWLDSSLSATGDTPVFGSVGDFAGTGSSPTTIGGEGYATSMPNVNPSGYSFNADGALTYTDPATAATQSGGLSAEKIAVEAGKEGVKKGFIDRIGEGAGDRTMAVGLAGLSGAMKKEYSPEEIASANAQAAKDARSITTAGTPSAQPIFGAKAPGQIVMADTMNNYRIAKQGVATA